MPHESHEFRWQGPALALAVLTLITVSVFWFIRGGGNQAGEEDWKAGTSSEAKLAAVAISEPEPDASLLVPEIGQAVRGYLGVRMGGLSPQLRQTLNYDGGKGAVVFSVIPHSPAEKAGLKPEDVIVGFDDHEVESRRHLFMLIQGSKVGEEVSMQVVRRGETLHIKTTIVEAIEGRAVSREGP